MSFLEFLNTLLLKPIQLIFEIIYASVNRLIDNPGCSIIVLSLAMNFLVLPLYRRADAMQEEQRDTELRLQKGIAHIRKTFHGDEQMMMLRTYYRQNGYKPSYVLRGAASLFLEIPFFIAAYRFLSELQLLQGVPFGPIADLGQPDGMLQIAGGGVFINVLPFIMTAVNLASCLIFTKDGPLKTKVQLYGMAVFFLVFLYASPSGLVFYWTLNNIFSLIKTIFYKLKNPGKILNIIFSTAGVCIWLYGAFSYDTLMPREMLFFTILGIILQGPAVFSFMRCRSLIKVKILEKPFSKAVFLSGGMFLSILTGVVIPSSVIKASPQEFVGSTGFFHPAWFIVSSFCTAFGIFVIWMGVFYWLASPSAKAVFDRAMWVLAGTGLVNYMFFNRHFGNLSARLKYEDKLEYTSTEQLLNLAVILVAAILLFIIAGYLGKRTGEILLIGTVALGIMSFLNISYINSSVEIVKDQSESNAEMPEFNLSKKGKNVIVLMLDRALGEQIPYLFDEKPDLKEQFSGFTYYSNTISFGMCTNLGAPALLGGYEYTPVEMNRRADESLVSKHNEALKVMPVLFTQNGYEVTVCNPVYANYQFIPDLTIYDDYPEIDSYITGDKFLTYQGEKTFVVDNKRNFFCYSLLKSMPLCMQKTIYNNGKYNQPAEAANEVVYSEQTMYSLDTAEGIGQSFMENYSVLENLSDISNITDQDINTYLFMVNDITHTPMLLQKPEYEPSEKVDNTEYEVSQSQKVLNGHTYQLGNYTQVGHYHANMAAMIQLGKWFDFMRREGVYDNTRIILVSDHGHDLWSLDELILDDGVCLSHFYPLLMVKDFGSKEFVTSDAFMTNADVPMLATDGIIDHPVNPFTGKILNADEKASHPQYIINSDVWNISENNGNTFLPADWYSVHDDIWDKDNWKLAVENAVLDEYE